MRINLNSLICPGRKFFRYCVIMFLTGILPFQAVVASANPDAAERQISQQQQSITVSGVVTDDNNTPLMGVTVFSAKHSVGTITDIAGKYRITVPAGTILTFSYIGYETATSPVNSTTLNISMPQNATEIEQVVMIGYGTQKKVTVTGAVASINASEIKQSSSANLAVALAGRLPGLMTMQTSGQPGRDEVIMYLRGKSTINGADPLIMIDGVPRSGIGTLDPNEVESISILKDASATAVFGVRGANGVILITTRRGSIGKPKLSISFDQSWQAFTRRPDRLQSTEFAELRNQALSNDGVAEADLEFTPYMIDMFSSGEDKVFFPNRDLYKEAVNTWAPQMRVNLNLNGGTDKVQYFMNVGYLNQGGNFKTESKSSLGYDPSYKLDRYNFRANVDYKLAKNLKVFVNLGSYIEKMNSPSLYGLTHLGTEGAYNTLITAAIQNLWSTPPTQPGPLTTKTDTTPGNEVIDRTGEYYGAMNRRGYHMATRTNLNATVGVEWDLKFITPGLTTKFMISYDNLAISDFDANRVYNLYNYEQAREEDEVSRYIGKEIDADNSLKLDKTFRSQFYMNMQYSINYARSFGKHDVSAMALLQRDNWDTWGADIPYNMLSLAGRVTYAYDYRYLAEVNVGYNGSEQFAKGKTRFGVFPAFSLGWVVSNESFLKHNRVITNLKLRATYGIVGNDKIGGSRFMYLDDYYLSTGDIENLGRGQMVNQRYNGNYNITWETAKKQNYGIDLQLFKDLSISFDYYIENRSDILSKRKIPDIQGVPSSAQPNVNIAKVDNKGFEVELTYFKAFSRDLSLLVKGNLAYNKNVLVFNDEVARAETYKYRIRGEGFPLGQAFGLMRDMSNGNGYINTQEELDWAQDAYKIGVPRLGDFKYIDENNDGNIDEKDEVPIGYGDIPRLSYGVALTLNWKGFDLSVLFQGVGQATKTYGGAGVYENHKDGFYTGYHRTAWTQDRYDNGAKITYPALTATTGVSLRSNDFFVMKSSFMRLKNIEIGYTLPGHLLKSAGISRVRIYVGGQNLFTWDQLRFNTFDPEMSNGVSYPIIKMINLGANITF